MRLSRRSFLVRTAALAAFGIDMPPTLTTSETPPKVTFPPVTLRGYGTLSAAVRTFDGGRSSLTHIVCESSEKALLTQAKYLSDLERLPGIERYSIRHRGATFPAHRTTTRGVVACFTRGRDVLILTTSDEAPLPRLLSGVLPLDATAADFAPRAPIPMYLDRWDRYGLICYLNPDARPPGTSSDGYDYGQRLAFARDNGPLGLIPWANALADDYAEGLTNEQAWGWVQENARKMGLPVHINLQFAPPQVWLANRYREQTMLKTPQFLGGYYGVAQDTAGVGAVSWLSQEAEDVQLGLLQSLVRRFAADPNIVGWLEPHGETAETPQKYYLDSGPYADEVWRAFLRRRYGTLRAVSLRWHGDPGYLTSWADVRVPEVVEFAGFGPGAIDLRGPWRVRNASDPAPPEWFQPNFDDGDWDELVAPGNDRMLSLPRRPLVYRRTLTLPEDWLDANPQVTLYIWDLINHRDDRTAVYVNGHPITEQSHNANEQHWSQFDVTGALRPGTNLLVLQMPRALICDRAYLTKEPPRRYPHLGSHQNARWVDFVAWNIESRGAQIRLGAEMIRQVDPDRPINFMAADDYYEPIKRICADYGGRFHDTGAMAGFWTERNTLMMTGAGLPVTAEPGNGAPNARDFQLFWGRWLTEGVNGVHYFQDLGEITWNPEVLAIFEANRPMYEMVGKYHSPFARVAVLYSLLNDCLTGFPWNAEGDGQGGYYSPFNAATQLIGLCPRDGVDARDFATGAVAKYRVIFDSNTSFMDAALIAGIARYVRQGGVFVTYGQTGRHTPTEPDTWPITDLTGYRVTHEYGWGDGRSASPASNQAMLTSGDLPPQTRTAGFGLSPNAPECRALAVWDDGTTAIGMRPLGRGWIVHLGPALGGDRFVAVAAALLRHFGMADRVPAAVAPQPGLHFRHFIGNTGLHDVWVLFNESDQPLTTDLTFLPGVHPMTLTDVVTRQTVPITRAPEGDAVQGLTLAPWQSRMFLSPRPDVAAAPLEWLTLQRGWWQGAKTPPAKRLPAPREMQRFSLDLTDGWACRRTDGLTDDQAASLARPAVNDAGWERRALDLWLTPGETGPKRLLLRRRFTVPAHWTNGPVTLCADVPIAEFLHETRMFLDGEALNGGRATVDGPYLDALGGTLKAGTTHWLALDIRSRASLLGTRGPIWLSYLPEPQDRQDLSGTWTAYADPLHRTGPVTLPGTTPAMFLSQTTVIPSVHAHQNVVVYYEATGDRFSLLINGHLLKRGEQFRESVCVFNVTPMVQFGTENVIELACGSGSGDKSVRRVEIRYYDTGVYP